MRLCLILTYHLPMKLRSAHLPSRSDIQFVVGALLAVGVLIAFVACLHAA